MKFNIILHVNIMKARNLIGIITFKLYLIIKKMFNQSLLTYNNLFEIFVFSSTRSAANVYSI